MVPLLGSPITNTSVVRMRKLESTHNLKASNPYAVSNSDASNSYHSEVATEKTLLPVL